MKKFQLIRIFEWGESPIGNFITKAQAVNEMEYVIDSNNDLLDEEESEKYLTPFDFKLAVIEISDVNKEIPDYETAKRYLGVDPLVKTSISAINPNNEKALIALNALLTIAKAWNLADNFTPNFTEQYNHNWFPYFKFIDNCFVCAGADCAANLTYAFIGSNLCFSTEERAIQFADQFRDLWNDYLL